MKRFGRVLIALGVAGLLVAMVPTSQAGQRSQAKPTAPALQGSGHQPQPAGTAIALASIGGSRLVSLAARLVR